MNTPSRVRASIIIPCHNDEAYAGEVIESALVQTHEPTEVIVIDDGSTDGSLGVIRSFGDRITWRTGENRGAPAARNRGLALASGEYVKFLDADDVLAEDAVERQVQAMQCLSDERVSIFGDLREDEDQGTLNGTQVEEASLEYLVGPGINTVCALHRRGLLTEVEGFTEGMPCGQEYEMHIRMRLAGIRFYYRPGAVLRKSHQTSGGISERTFAGRDPFPRMNLFRRVGTLLRQAFGEVPEEARGPLARRWWITGRQALRGGHKSEAKSCFAEAQSLTGECAVGSIPYRTANRMVGPIWAEHVGTWLKKASLLK